MTPAETYTRVKAYVYSMDKRAENFRALFTLQYNQWAKPSDRKTPQQLWPLSIDEIEQMSEEEMYERNRLVIEDYYRRHPEKLTSN